MEGMKEGWKEKIVKLVSLTEEKKPKDMETHRRDPTCCVLQNKDSDVTLSVYAQAIFCKLR